MNKKEQLKFDPYDKKVYSLEEYIAACYGGLPSEVQLERQWNELQDVTIGYDSKADTLEHKVRVSELIGEFCSEMLRRASKHDNSKLTQFEKPYFDSETPKLKKLTYGSDEYKESLKKLGKALTHHYTVNRHHPECFENGIDGMSLFDIVEMIFDWKAATERHEDGDIFKSIEINQERFQISEQLKEILLNTASQLKWDWPETLTDNKEDENN